MKYGFRIVIISVLVIIILYQSTGCSSPNLPHKDSVEDKEIVNDIPTVPENVPEGIDYLYDFLFSERYDNNITADFSLVLPDKVSLNSDILYLFEKYNKEIYVKEEYLYDGDGMVPYMIKRYWHTFEKGDLMIGTHYYEPDNLEYISYLWSNIEGVSTNKNVGVGSSEKELLSVYTNNLYYLDKDEALSEIGLSAISIMGYNEDSSGELDEDYDFDYAYMWQPFTPETNEIRDITFYIIDGKVVAIEVIEPFELRHVYGYDRDAGLEYTKNQNVISSEVKEEYYFEPNVSIIEGTLITRLHYGPPRFGEDPENDEQQYPFILLLDDSINVIAEDTDTLNSNKSNVLEIQLVLKGEPYVNMAKQYKNKHVKVQGTLFTAFTGHHHTEVLLVVDEFLDQ